MIPSVTPSVTVSKTDLSRYLELWPDSSAVSITAAPAVGATSESAVSLGHLRFSQQNAYEKTKCG